MAINVEMLTEELLDAGLDVTGCNCDGVVWGPDGAEIQKQKAVAAVVKAHDPEKVVEATFDTMTQEEKDALLKETLIASGVLDADGKVKKDKKDK